MEEIIQFKTDTPLEFVILNKMNKSRRIVTMTINELLDRNKSLGLADMEEIIEKVRIAR